MLSVIGVAKRIVQNTHKEKKFLAGIAQWLPPIECKHNFIGTEILCRVVTDFIAYYTNKRNIYVEKPLSRLYQGQTPIIPNGISTLHH